MTTVGFTLIAPSSPPHVLVLAAPRKAAETASSPVKPNFLANTVTLYTSTVH